MQEEMQAAPRAACREAAPNEPIAAGVGGAYDIVPPVDLSPCVLGYLQQLTQVCLWH